jgi:uncharacterized membrane protein (UPF0127 family)
MESGYIFINETVFPSLFAISDEEQRQGLMFQKNPPIMSFIYPHSQSNRFWMQNTSSALDIVFCNNGKVMQICKGVPYSLSSIGSVDSDLVIEMPYGTVKIANITLGNSVGFVKPDKTEILKILAKRYNYLSKF